MLVKKYLILFLVLVFCSNNISNQETTSSNLDLQQSENVLTQILDSYKTYSSDPEGALDTIWGFAHPNNKEVTGPKENFEKMLLSEPYSAILDLKEYSFTKTVETEDSNHYEIKILANNNSYFEVIWVFQFDECPDNPKDNCWLTIAVTAPSYYESGV